MFAKAFTFASLASLASAHMLMANPKPYGQIDNSPLEGDGSNFPCKNAVNDGTTTNVYEQGSIQQLSFTGQATHGGGSCQISLTTDKNPTKNSVWKVIKSIEGGCPAKGQEGNMGGNADAPDPYKYDFTIPKELAAGDYTLAWTWFNKVGNREMYMNCAAVTIEGSGGSKDHLDSLPDMFVANLGDGCETIHDQDLVFPNAGKDVDRFNGATDAFKGPNDKCTAAPGGGSNPSPTGGSNAPAPTGGNEAPTPTGDNAQPTQPQATQPAVTQTASPGSGDGSNGAPQLPGGGVFITVSQPASSQPAATQAPETPAAPETPKTPDNGSGEEGSGEGNKGGDAGSGSGGFAAGTACTSEGEWNCVGGSTFQRCASGTWSATQQLSSGVSCTPGQGADIGMTAKRGARAMRRAARHSS